MKDAKKEMHKVLNFISDVKSRPLKTERWPGEIELLRSYMRAYWKLDLGIIDGRSKAREALKRNEMEQDVSFAYSHPEDYLEYQRKWIKDHPEDYE